MTELLVCWIDLDYDRAYASDGQSRYGAYVRDYSRLFDPWQDAPDGVTGDPVEFAIAAFRVASAGRWASTSSTGRPGPEFPAGPTWPTPPPRWPWWSGRSTTPPARS
jgi:hypothetical protein